MIEIGIGAFLWVLRLASKMAALGWFTRLARRLCPSGLACRPLLLDFVLPHALCYLHARILTPTVCTHLHRRSSFRELLLTICSYIVRI